MNYETTEDEGATPADVELGGNMGTAYMVTGIFHGQASYDPIVGLRNGVTIGHLDLFWAGLTEGFEHARSAWRTGVNTRMVCVYTTSAKRGNEPQVVTDKRVQIERLAPEKIAPLWEDYAVTMNAKDLRPGTELYVWCDGIVTKTTADGTVTTVPSLPTDPANRMRIHFFIGVKESNPNGDPGDGGRPRVNWENHGRISCVSTKRVTRDWAADVGEVALFMRRPKDALDSCQKVQEQYITRDKKGKVATYERDRLLKENWDVPLFGGVITQTGDRVVGALQVHVWATSLDPVELDPCQFTRVLPGEKKAKGEKGTKGKREQEEIEAK